MYESRNKAIYKDFCEGKSQKWLAIFYVLSVSRVKAICGEQKKIEGGMK